MTSLSLADAVCDSLGSRNDVVSALLEGCLYCYPCPLASPRLELRSPASSVELCSCTTSAEGCRSVARARSRITQQLQMKIPAWKVLEALQHRPYSPLVCCGALLPSPLLQSQTTRSAGGKLDLALLQPHTNLTLRSLLPWWIVLSSNVPTDYSWRRLLPTCSPDPAAGF